MLPFAQPLLPAIASVIVFLLWKGLQLIWYHAYKSPLRHLRGPKATSFILGNLNEVVNDENGELMGKWVKEYGKTLRFKGLLCSDHLFTVDTSTINHILSRDSNDYQKAPTTRQGLAEIFGEGLLSAEGMRHRQQRRIMNPAFGPAQVRALTATFLAKASQLCDLWSSQIANDPSGTVTGARIDIVPWLNRVTFDIICLTGFNCDFDSLGSSGEPNELSEAFATMFAASQNFSILNILQVLIPILRVLPTAGARKIRAARRTTTKLGEGLLASAKSAALVRDADKGEIEKSSPLHGRDLLSLLVKANMATDIPESQKLPDIDVVAQVPTFFIAGHDSTSTAVIWALYALTQAPDVQTKLRDELLFVDTDTPSMDDLMALPYLDIVVRETLRVHAPVPATTRIATKDDVLPVEKPYVDRYGTVRDTISIVKGDGILIPIATMNLSTELWGPDAHEFRPERWNDLPENVSRVPGVWGHLLTFFGGPRACIGYRFSLVELKAILFSLVRAFEFELAVPASEVCSRMAIVQRPVLRSDPTHHPQLPLLIRPHQRM